MPSGSPASMLAALAPCISRLAAGRHRSRTDAHLPPPRRFGAGRCGCRVQCRSHNGPGWGSRRPSAERAGTACSGNVRCGRTAVRWHTLAGAPQHGRSVRPVRRRPQVALHASTHIRVSCQQRRCDQSRRRSGVPVWAGTPAARAAAPTLAGWHRRRCAAAHGVPDSPEVPSIGRQPSHTEPDCAPTVDTRPATVRRWTSRGVRPRR